MLKKELFKWLCLAAFIGALSPSPRAAGTSLEDCEQFLRVNNDPTELIEHHSALSQHNRFNLRLRKNRAHFKILIERARQVLADQNLQTEIIAPGKILIHPAPGLPNRKRPLDQVIAHLKNRGFSTTHSPWSILVNAYGSSFDGWIREIGIDESFALGEVNFLLQHELRHFYHLNLWRTGRRSPFNISYSANRPGSLGTKAPYLYEVDSEELDCVVQEIIAITQKIRSLRDTDYERETLSDLWDTLEDRAQIGSALAAAIIKNGRIARNMALDVLSHFQIYEIYKTENDETILARPHSPRQINFTLKEGDVPAVALVLSSFFAYIKLPTATDFFVDNPNSRRSAKALIRQVDQELSAMDQLARTHQKHFEKILSLIKDGEYYLALKASSRRIGSFEASELDFR